jgi:hypothetical protein
MHANRPAPEQKLDLPPDLLAELKSRGPKPRVDMGVEAFRKSPSFFDRLVEMFAGRRSG